MKESLEQEQTTERITFIAEQIEKKILVADEVFLAEPDRLWLKQVVEKYERNLGVIRDGANLSQQGEDLIKFFEVNSLRNQGCDGVASIVSNTVVNLLETESGNVFENSTVSEEEQFMVGAFIQKYFEDFYEKEYQSVPDNYKKGSWERKTIYRMEAVMAVMSKLLWLLAADDEVEAKRRQNTNGVQKHLKERVLRGFEKEGKVIQEGVSRIDKDEVIRHLPVGAIAFILDSFSRI